MNLIRKDRILISILMLALTFLINQARGQDCDKLSDGKYKVKFKKQYGGAKFVLMLDGDNFTDIKDNQEIKGKITFNRNCSLHLDYLIKPDTTNAVQQLLSMSSKPYYVFEKTSGKRLKFRLTGLAGHHITAGEGHFIKVD